MTCIAAVAHGGKVWMAGDSAAVTEYSVVHLAEPKVCKIGPFLVGVAGNAGIRLHQIMRYTLVVPDEPVMPFDALAWLVRAVLPALSDCLKVGGFLKQENGVEQIGDDVSVLLGYRERLYEIDACLQVVALSEGYGAIGSGAEAALGSLFSTARQYSSILDDPEQRVVLAVRAAARHARGVREPITVVCV